MTRILVTIDVQDSDTVTARLKVAMWLARIFIPEAFTISDIATSSK
jgi:hypothetical protein